MAKYEFRGGRRVEITRTVGNHPEVTVTAELETYVCPECGKEYKTEGGRDRHLDSYH